MVHCSMIIIVIDTSSSLKSKYSLISFSPYVWSIILDKCAITHTLVKDNMLVNIICYILLILF